MNSQMQTARAEEEEEEEEEEEDAPDVPQLHVVHRRPLVGQQALSRHVIIATKIGPLGGRLALIGTTIHNSSVGEQRASR